MLKRGSILAFALLLIAGSVARPALADGPSARGGLDLLPDGACADGESWTLTPSLRQKWESFFSSAPSNAASAIERYFAAYEKLKTLRAPEERILAEYWIWRSVYQMNFLAIAHSGFRSIASREMPSQLDGIRLAAIECLNKIRGKYPALELSEKESAAILGFPDARIPARFRPVLWEARANLAIKKLSKSSGADLSAELVSLKDSGPYLLYVRAMASLKDQNEDAVKQLEHYLSSIKGLPSDLRSKEDFTRLSLARTKYTLGQHDKAIQELLKIGRESPLFPQALSDQAWANLLKKDYSKAVGNAYNLQVSGLAKSFAPDAPIIAAISFYEVCRYPEALQNTQMFLKKYGPAYRWLSDWSEKSQKRPIDLYKLALQLLKKKTKVPKVVAAQWVRSPVFISTQGQLNSLLDERELVQPMIKQIVRAYAKDKKRNKAAALYLRNVLLSYPKEINRIEAHMVDRMNAELTRQNNLMLSRLDELAETAQLLEVDIFNIASRKLVTRDLIKGGKKSVENGRQIARAESKSPSWFWGRLPVSEIENSETWEDELGLYNADLSDQCGSGGK